MNLSQAIYAAKINGKNIRIGLMTNGKRGWEVPVSGNWTVQFLNGGFTFNPRNRAEIISKYKKLK